jgi:hypothetical protein
VAKKSSQKCSPKKNLNLERNVRVPAIFLLLIKELEGRENLIKEGKLFPCPMSEHPARQKHTDGNFSHFKGQW